MSGRIEKRVPVMLPDGHVASYIRSVASEDEPAPEDALAVKVYGEALKQLAGEDRRYISNFNIWQRWDGPTRAWWIGQIEAQAAAGKDTIGVRVVTRAAVIRLTGETT